jgi:lysophospholipase L1-like esterase
VSEDFRRFVALVHGGLPATDVLYLPIKPSLARWAKWPKMLETNSRILEFIRRNDQLSYVDTATPMLGADGRPRRELFLDDGLHLNATGYRLWSEILRDQLASIHRGKSSYE